MKNQTQIILLLVVVVVFIGGITFVRQWYIPPETPTSQRDRPADGDDPKGVLEQIDPPPNPGPRRLITAADAELLQPCIFDFWFANRHPRPVEVALHDRSCTCSDLQLGIIDLPDWQSYQAQTAAWYSVLGLVAPGRSLDLLVPASLDYLNQKVRWQDVVEVKLGGKPVTVPAASSAGPAVAVIRLTWKGKTGKKLGPDRLAMTLVENGTPYRLELPVNLVAAIDWYPRSLSLPKTLEADSREKATMEFLCWSTTRRDFDLHVQDKSKHPCIVCEWKRLERAELMRDISQAMRENSPPNPPKSGYRVTVTVHEKQGDQQLDLGPFRRQLELRVDPAAEPYTLELSGAVRGDITIVSDADKEHIDLGPFNAANGTTRTEPWYIESSQVNLELGVDSVSPEYLQVKLDKKETKDGMARWPLHVKVPPNSPPGRFSADAALILKTKSNPPRRLRIPIVGNAYR